MDVFALLISISLFIIVNIINMKNIQAMCLLLIKESVMKYQDESGQKS
jgi:hypothetical protein